MRKRPAWLYVVGVPLVLVVLYKLMYPTYTWRQKITVEVQVGDEVHSASSVSEMRVTFTPKILPDASPLDISLRGEAVILDIPGRGVLFALLSIRGSEEEFKYLAVNVFRDRIPKRSSKAIFSSLARIREKRPISSNYYPLLVTFADTADPTTMRKVDPGDFSAVFGTGVSLKRIILEITEEDLTEESFTEKLEWLNWSRDRFLASGNGETPLKIGGASIGQTSFSRMRQ